MLELHNLRLSLTPVENRWRPILERQVGLTRQRSKGFVDLANEERGNDPEIIWSDPIENQKGQRIKVVLDTFDPDDRLCVYQRGFRGKPTDWLGTYDPDASHPSVENVGGWKAWYRIEYSG
jgi:hypothetical protein